MEIMIDAKAASSTEGANHDLVTVLNKEYQIISVTYQLAAFKTISENRPKS